MAFNFYMPDIGEGVVVRYDEGRKEVVGITILGFRTKTLQSIAGGSSGLRERY